MSPQLSNTTEWNQFQEVSPIGDRQCINMNLEKEMSGMIEMMFREHLTEEQQKTLLLRFLDLKIKKKTMNISK